MRVLIACEFSGRVRNAFSRLGHFAVSCDLIPTEQACVDGGGGMGRHYTGDVLDLLYLGCWDMLIAFPPCTYLASSGARWWANRQPEQEAAMMFFTTLYYSPVPKIAIENPIGKPCTYFRQPDQRIQPWWFGEPTQKTTCLWLKNLPKLIPTDTVNGRNRSVWYKSETSDRKKFRSRTFEGVAEAMAKQWGEP